MNQRGKQPKKENLQKLEMKKAPTGNGSSYALSSFLFLAFLSIRSQTHRQHYDLDLDLELLAEPKLKNRLGSRQLSPKQLYLFNKVKTVSRFVRALDVFPANWSNKDFLLSVSLHFSFCLLALCKHLIKRKGTSLISLTAQKLQNF